ncbi:hypothetical protein [Desulfatitalea tepidiphila]|uniref:hypothetical protein n=1 Tax=Desulfatitalea tepidiphila TaxID=1185843 RepID=UPI0006B61658|nr:hypothetical protein [Desulfatitalea tepidiphila]
MASYYLGIDVQIRRHCSYAVIDDQGTLTESGWFSDDPLNDAVSLVKWIVLRRPVQIGIDAPRMPLETKRIWFWNGNQRRWNQSNNRIGNGRHCEIVLSAHRIANPQWTPIKIQAPAWMKLGFRLYETLEGQARIHEVFPSASYTLLSGVRDVRVDIDFSACRPGPKDMLDAWVAAATVREFVEGRGVEVGDGDGLGTIILPRPIPGPVIKEVLKWPEN